MAMTDDGYRTIPTKRIGPDENGDFKEVIKCRGPRD